MTPLSTARTIVPFLLTITLSLGALSADGTAEGPPQEPESREDAALIYLFIPNLKGPDRFVRPLVFGDDTLLGKLRPGMYRTAYLAPGGRLIWIHHRVTRQLEVVAGETYYFDVYQMSPVEEGVARKILTTLSPGPLITDDQVEKAHRLISKSYARAISHEADKVTVVVDDVVHPDGHDDVAGRVRVPSGTRIELEFIQSVSSTRNAEGDRVWLRVREPVVVGGQVLIDRDSVVEGVVRQSQDSQVRPAGGDRNWGVLEVIIPAVRAGDGTLIPVVGQFLKACGANAAAAANSAAISGAAAAGAFGAWGWVWAGANVALSSSPSVHPLALIGQTVDVFTREEVWLKPIVESRASALDAVADGRRPRFTGEALQPVLFAPDAVQRKKQRTLEIVIRTDRDVAEVELSAIGETALPRPIRAVETFAEGLAKRLLFDEWEVMSFMRPLAETTKVPVRFRGLLEGGDGFEGEAELLLTIKAGKKR